MFSKPSKPAPRPAAAPIAPRATLHAAPQQPAEAPVPRRPQMAASVIGKDIAVEGNVSGEGELQVDGVLRGDVRVGRLSIGETGRIEGTVTAELVEVRGRINGSITARQIRLFATAQVDGDITHEQLAMETGASFQGRSLKFQRQAAPAVPTADVIKLGAASA
jgi:cytoskeletal protein CcmA (bactofilin family)